MNGKIFYNGAELDVKKIICEWRDHFGVLHKGDLDDMIISERSDATDEALAGEDW